MYNVILSNGIYYLRHQKQNVLANLSRNKFVKALDDHFNLNPIDLSILTYALSVGDFKSVNELIN